MAKRNAQKKAATKAAAPTKKAAAKKPAAKTPVAKKGAAKSAGKTVRSLVKAVVKAAGRLAGRAQAVRTSPAAKAAKFVYYFGDGKAEGNRTMKDTLGGKGSGLAEMTNAGLPVPPGFTISTAACNFYYANHGKLTPAIEGEIEQHIARLEKSASVRQSGAFFLAVEGDDKAAAKALLDALVVSSS